MPTKNKKTPPPTPQLTRLSQDKVIAGVCSGLAAFFGLDPVVIRIIFVILTLFQGLGVFLYLLLWITVPRSNKQHKTSSAVISANAEEIKQTAENIFSKLDDSSSRSHSSLGLFLLILGIVFLLINFNIISWDQFSKLWPLALILFALTLLVKRS